MSKNEYFSKRKNVLLAIGIALFIGALIGKIIILIMAVGVIVYLILRKKGYLKSTKNESSDVHDAKFNS